MFVCVSECLCLDVCVFGVYFRCKCVCVFGFGDCLFVCVFGVCVSFGVYVC